MTKCPTCHRPMESGLPLWLIATVETAIVTAAAIAVLMTISNTMDTEWYAVAAVACAAASGKLATAPQTLSKLAGK